MRKSLSDLSSNISRQNCSIIDNGRRDTERSRMVELPVPPPESDCKNGRSAGRSLTRSKTLLISAQGQCTPIPDDEPDGGPESAPKAPEAALASRSFRQIFRGSVMYFLLQVLLWLKGQGKEKDVDATEDVLARYHNSYLYGAVPLTIRVRTALRSGNFGHALLFLEFAAAVISVVAYVNSTYTITPAHWALTAPKVCAIFFATDYILRLYSAPARLYYIVSITGLVDLLSTLSVLTLWSEFRSDIAIPHMFLVIRALRILPTFLSAGIIAGTTTQQIFLLTMYTLGGVFIAAGILQWVEYKATSAETKAKNGCEPTGCLSLYDSFYFVIVTLTTVGYGDLTPKSDWGRAFTLLIMLAAVLILPAQINKILQLAERRPYGGRFPIQKAVGSCFVVLSGNLSVRTVERFLSGFYHPCHEKDMAAFPIRVIVMAPFKPSYEMKTLLTYYRNQVQFIEGTPLKESDLDRVGAIYASAVFLLADEHAQDFDAEDAAQITRTLSVHRHCGQKVRVIVELLKPDTRTNAIWDDFEEGIEIVCPEAVRFQLLARSCHIKGFSTLVTNLFRTGLMLRCPTSGHWMTQYDHGLRQKIFPVILPSCFSEDSFTFEEAVEIVYTKCNAVLIGLDIKAGDGSRSVVLYPKGRTVVSSDIGLVIARDLQITENISKYGRSGRRACFLRTLDEDVEMAVKKRPRRRPSFSSNILQQEGGQDSRKDSSGSKRVDVQGQFRQFYNSGSSNGQSNGGQSNGQSEQVKRPSAEVDRLFSSLEEVIDMATSWPPVSKWDKPDPTVLERRESTILESLRRQTMTVVVLKHPHVLLCIEGRWPLNLFYFVASMRLPFMPKLPIVVLHPKEPTASQWGCVGMFEDVFFVRGSALYELDLVRAGVIQAEKVVIFTQGFEDDLPAVDESGLLVPSVNKLDVKNIVIAANVERLLNPVRGKVLVELQQEIQLQFLRPHIRIDADLFEPKMFQRDRDSRLLFTPPVIEGKGLCPASFTFLSYSTFFNKNVVSILEQLACGRSVSHLEEDGESSPVRRLEQIPVPESYVGRTYEELFLGLLHNEKMVTLGLYRPPGTGGSTVFFVSTNPLPSTELVHGDLVYVLQ